MNTKEVIHNGKIYVFVTRGRSKPFSNEEIELYLGTKLEQLDTSLPKKEAWEGIPDVKQRKAMFVSDLRLGIDFCIKKYGASREEIIAEAQRIAPFVRVD